MDILIKKIASGIFEAFIEHHKNALFVLIHLAALIYDLQCNSNGTGTLERIQLLGQIK
jgi:hypothetical protein